MLLSSFKTLTFSAGEQHVVLQAGMENDGFLLADIRSSSALMNLLLATDVLKRNGMQPRTLVLPYLPYGRQDRVTDPEKLSPFSLRVFGRLINELGYSRVRTYEAHSAAAFAEIDNLENVSMWPEVDTLLQRLGWPSEDTVILLPDKGAFLRSQQEAAVRVPSFHVWYGEKSRDPSTGSLVYKEIRGVDDKPVDATGLHVLVVDDICDGGATFKMLHPRLAGARSTALFVAHGIFSKGLDALSMYDTVATTDTFQHPSPWLWKVPVIARLSRP
jgi:ribose-phosphate pyrophosphokinase